MHITTSKKVDLVGVSKNEDVVVLRPLTHYRVEYVRSDGEPDEVVGSYLEVVKELRKHGYHVREKIHDRVVPRHPSQHYDVRFRLIGNLTFADNETAVYTNQHLMGTFRYYEMAQRFREYCEKAAVGEGTKIWKSNSDQSPRVVPVFSNIYWDHWAWGYVPKEDPKNLEV